MQATFGQLFSNSLVLSQTLLPGNAQSFVTVHVPPHAMGVLVGTQTQTGSSSGPTTVSGIKLIPIGSESGTTTYSASVSSMFDGLLKPTSTHFTLLCV
jgi:hypothetical protein